MFKKAIPVFAEGQEAALNYPLTLCATLDTLEGATLYVTAFSFYRLVINGKFVCMGPARCAKGYARVDKIELEGWGKEGGNLIEIQTVGYNCSSLSTARQSSFVACEIRRGDDVILYTGRDFEAYLDCRRIREVERYSAQRHFGEMWRVFDGDFRDRSQKVSLAPASNRPKYLDRHVPMPIFDKVDAGEYASRGEFCYDETIEYLKNQYSFRIGEEWGCFDENEIASKPFRWLQRQKKIKKADGGTFPIELCEGEYITVDMKLIECGTVCFRGEALAESDVVIGFSERCAPDDFKFTSINCQNVIEYFVESGAHIDHESFEPYTCKVAIIMVRRGNVRVDCFGIRRVEFDRSRFIDRKIDDGELASIYEAAKTTFAHNAVDLYSDCPSRERAGWLCDSYFTGRAEYFLTGNSVIEDAFLENYRLFENEAPFPEGVLPMCYPSDAPPDNNKYIPQWDMWYVLEVRDYLTKRNTSVDRELFRKSVMGILTFLRAHENSDGLLQNLPSWNFVEWSDANSWVQDVNYPTNFLYAEVLRAADELYGDGTLTKKASEVARKTRELSFDGEVFIDNAKIGDDGRLVNTRNSSEAGQYYAILFGEFDINEPKYAKLKAHIFENFKNFDTTGRGFVAVNAFIGFYLKMWALMELGERELLCRYIKDFFGGMVASTGTLWEYKEGKGSLDHGFASFAAIAIDFIENS